MNRTAFIAALAVLAALTASADKVLTPMQTAYLRRAYVHHQESERLADGSVRLVRHIYRGATPLRVETNVLHAVEGKLQNNPLHNALENARAELAERRAELSEKVAALADSEARRERVQARHDRLVARITEKRDEAKLATTRALYQALLDLLDDDSE